MRGNHGRFIRLRCAAAITTASLVALLLAGQAAAGAADRSSATRHPAAARSGPAARYKPGMVLVGFRPGVTAARRHALERAIGGTWERPLGYIGSATPAARALTRRLGSSYTIGVPRGTVAAAVRRLRAQRRWVRYAEPNYLLRPSPAVRSQQVHRDALPAVTTSGPCTSPPTTGQTPNDPCFGLQWGDLNTGQTIDGSSTTIKGGPITGTAGDDDHVTQAWRVTTGSRSIVIGQVDSGVDYNHPDLNANIWSNPNGILGCPAGSRGYNVMTSSCDAPDDDPPSPTSYNGHGTHVAGMMGAVGNNGIGVAGVNWQTTILPVKWLTSVNTGGSVGDLVNAMAWVLKAKDAGVNVRVVNDSPVYTDPSYNDSALAAQIQALGAANILFVTAAGGAVSPDGTTYSGAGDASSNYPCAYSLVYSNVICVTGTDQNDNLAFWADYGADVQLAAPADNLYSTLENNGYGFISGGSMAAAQVSGAAALILSAQNLSMAQLKADILDHVQKLPSLTGKVTTGGMLDVCAAMPGCTSPLPTTTKVTCTPASVAVGAASTCTATVTDSDASMRVPPSGSVAFRIGSKAPFTSCNLSSTPETDTASCQVQYRPSAAGSAQLTASYAGDSRKVHAPSSGATSVSGIAKFVPAIRTAPTISGSARPNRTLTCHAGTWTNAPTRFAYRWTRNGATIRGATGARYRVQIADESTRLQCTVTASNAAGHGSATAHGRGALVAVAGTLGCPQPSGRLQGRTLGPLSLGMTRRRVANKLGRFVVAHGHADGVCLYGGWGIDAVYAARGHLQGRIVLLVTSNRHYSTQHVGPGISLRTARRRLKLGRGLHVGGGVWYVVRGRSADLVLAVSRGIVDQVGIATPSLAGSVAAQRGLLRSAPHGIVEVAPSRHRHHA